MAHVFRLFCLTRRTVDGKTEVLLSTRAEIREFAASDSFFATITPIEGLPLDRGRRYRLTLELDE